MESVIRILIVDDHTVFRHGLVRLLDGEPGFEVVGHCGSVDAAARIAAQVRPDIALLEIGMPGRPVTDLFNQLPAGVSLPALLVTAATDAREIARLLCAGARGVFSKLTDCDRLPGAIRRVLKGELWVDQAYLREFIAMVAEVPAEPESPACSAREQDVLERVGRGRSNKQIAVELNCSEPAVKAALQRLFRKYSVGNRAQLVAASTGRTRALGAARFSLPRAVSATPSE
jgi:two-component system nitrate/nitrite response regulator NarL